MTRMLCSLLMLFVASPACADVGSLFAALRDSTSASARAHRLTQPMSAYATNDDDTVLCYVSGGVIYFYRLADDSVTQAAHAKMFNVAAVNRITWRANAHGGAFLLWVDESLELSIGS